MALNFQHLDKWLKTVGDAIDAGATKRGALTLHWDASGKEGTNRKCSSPVAIEHRGAQAVNIHANLHRVSSDNPAYTLEIQARCRKCPGCLKARADFWRMAAMVETLSSERTWFGTLTLNPQTRFMLLSRVRLRLANGGTDFEALTEAQQFSEIVRECNPAITRYLKRVRKEYGGPIRYLLVTEAHKDGMPHWHLLVHQCTKEALLYDTLKCQWKGGFAHFKLVAQGEAHSPARYVTKYLTKEARTRVRASLEYGNPPTQLLAKA